VLIKALDMACARSEEDEHVHLFQLGTQDEDAVSQWIHTWLQDSGERGYYHSHLCGEIRPELMLYAILLRYGSRPVHAQYMQEEDWQLDCDDAYEEDYLLVCMEDLARTLKLCREEEEAKSWDHAKFCVPYLAYETEEDSDLGHGGITLLRYIMKRQFWIGNHTRIDDDRVVGGIISTASGHEIPFLIMGSKVDQDGKVLRLPHERYPDDFRESNMHEMWELLFLDTDIGGANPRCVSGNHYGEFFEITGITFLITPAKYGRKYTQNAIVGRVDASKVLDI